MSPAEVRQSGKIGSERRAVKVTRLTQSRPSPGGAISAEVAQSGSQASIGDCQTWHLASRSNCKEQAMMNLKVLAAVVIAASALSSSAALAQAALSNPDECQAEFASCTGLGTGGTPTGVHRQSTRRSAYRQPAAAAATVGSWGNSYAMSGEMGWHGNWNTYAARNGIVCKPGTYFKGADGLRHLCQ
ncbi:hypothetical protein DXU04_28595 [Bradyrhizobium diazoefficiens]